MTKGLKNKTQLMIFCFVWLVALSIFFISIGSKVAMPSGYTVVFDKTEYSNTKDLMVGMALKSFLDIAAVFLITVAYRSYLSVVISSVILAMRGISLGACTSFCAENAVSSVSVVMIVSFALVSLLILIYTVFLNRVSLGIVARLGAYFLVTGAVTLIRLLPLLLL